MKLYHASSIENKENIIESGIMPNETPMENAYASERCLDNGIFGFTALKDALSFARDQSWDGAVVFSFEAEESEIVVDPEYDGEAYFLRTDEKVGATLVFDYDQEV